MKTNKIYNQYKKFLKLKFTIGYSQQQVIKLFSKRFNLSKKYSQEITFLFYNQFLNKLTRKTPWPIVNL